MHVDMDMFYAAVEMRDQPELADKPMAVGGMGMLSTSNYKVLQSAIFRIDLDLFLSFLQARRFGVRAAMPGFIAKKLCPQLTIVPTNMTKYAAVAEQVNFPLLCWTSLILCHGQVREVFKEYDPDFCPMSLDEAYLDITGLVVAADGDDVEEVASSIVTEMRAKIKEKTGLTASAGIACNCRLAKVASDMNKPDGQFLVAAREEDILDFVHGLSIRKVGGIGNISEQLLNRAVGVYTCKDIYEKRAEIKLLFSEITFEFYMEVSQGLGATSVEPPDERERKSMSTETTFQDTADRKVLVATCKELCKDLAKDLASKEILGSAVTVKIKSHDFKLKTKVAQLVDHTNDENVIFESAERTLLHLLDTAPEKPLKLRLMGVRMTDLKDKAEVKGAKQTSLRTFMAAKTGEGKASKKYICPICEHIYSGVRVLNDHIDLCISENQEADDKLHTKDYKESPSEVETQTRNLDPTTMSLDSSSEMTNSSSSFQLETLVSSKSILFVCPVCSASLRLSTEEEMGKHVEDCLSQKEVSAIVMEEKAKLTAPMSSKRKLVELETRGHRKRMKVGQIDSFFSKC